MSDTDTLNEIRAIVSAVDPHRNREKRDALEAIRGLLGIVEAPPAPPAEPAPAADDGDDVKVATLEDLTKAQLVALCTDHGLDTKGNRPVLIERLRSLVPPADVDEPAVEGDAEPTEPTEADAEPEADADPTDDAVEGDAEDDGPHIADDEE